MSKAPKGDHSFQPGGAGKGDADRTSDVESFRANYDEINWGRKAIGVFTPDFLKLLKEQGLGVDDRPLRFNYEERPYLEQERND